jgi:hypothetical protein
MPPYFIRHDGGNGAGMRRPLSPPIQLFILFISIIMDIKWINMARRSILHLSPLFSSKKIDSARSRSGLFFALFIIV